MYGAPAGQDNRAETAQNGRPMITHQTITIAIDETTWRIWLEKLAHEGIFDSPGDALEWAISADMGDQLEVTRARCAADDGGDPDPEMWPYTMEGVPASWGDALEQARAIGRRQRLDKDRRYNAAIAARIPPAFLPA